MHSYAITPQNNKYVTIKVQDWTNQFSTHSLRLPINPSLKGYTHGIRTTATQTEGGMWVDNFGMGYPILQLQGNTGWRPLYGLYNNKTVPDGYQAFYHLYDDIINYFFNLQRMAKPSDTIEMIVVDDVDGMSYRVIPTQNISLQRNRQTPLLFPYTINFIVLWSNLSTQAMQRVQDPVVTITQGNTPNTSPTPPAVKSIINNVRPKIATVRQPPKRTYTVKTGDTLWGIAQWFYGNGSLDTYLAHVNHIADPDLIFANQVIQVPYR